MVITILLMAVGTTMTGLLPGYSTIGVWAPILLLVARILQGLSTGGEFVGAMTYLVERAPDHKRGMMVGFLPLGNLVGFVLAGMLVTALQAWLPADDMLAWGWRIPLLLGAPFGVLALYPAAADQGVARLMNRPSGSTAGRPRLAAISAHSGGAAEADGDLRGPGGDLPGPRFHAHRILADIPQSWFVHVGKTAGLVMIVATLAILMAAVVFVATLSDRIGVKPIMWTGCGLLVVASVPAFLLMRFGGIFPLVFIGVLLIGLMELCFDSTTPAALPALFPTRVRNGALAISYNIALSTVGGTTPLIAQALISQHRQRPGAGLHADLRGPGRDGLAAIHARSRWEAAAGVRALGRKRGWRARRR